MSGSASFSCLPGSESDPYVQKLSSVQSWSLHFYTFFYMFFMPFLPSFSVIVLFSSRLISLLLSSWVASFLTLNPLNPPPPPVRHCLLELSCLHWMCKKSSKVTMNFFVSRWRISHMSVHACFILPLTYLRGDRPLFQLSGYPASHSGPHKILPRPGTRHGTAVVVRKVAMPNNRAVAHSSCGPKNKLLGKFWQKP